MFLYVNIDTDNNLKNNYKNYDKPNATLNRHEYSTSNGSLIFDNALAGTYYVSVTAMAGSGEHFYSLLATTHRIVLTENIPQMITTQYSKLKQYDGGYYFSF